MHQEQDLHHHYTHTIRPALQQLLHLLYQRDSTLVQHNAPQHLRDQNKEEKARLEMILSMSVTDAVHYFNHKETKEVRQ